MNWTLLLFRRCLQSSLLFVLVTFAIPAPAHARGVAEEPRDRRVDTELFMPIINASAACPQMRTMPSTVFGVQMYGNTGAAGNPYFAPLIDSNSSWVRAEAAWKSVEPTNRTWQDFNWVGLDRELSGARDGGVNMIATIGHAPSWAASSGNGPIDKTELSEFVDFVSALVERYDGDGYRDAYCSPVILNWEFYNEPDGAPEAFGERRWGDVGDEYADMLKAVYPAVKAANPDARVLLGGIAYDWFTADGGPFVESFLTDVLDAGGGDYFDVMNFHAYPAFAPRWTTTGPGLYEKTGVLRTLLEERGYEKPFVITESGAHSNDDPVSPSSPEEQARYVVELFTQARAADVDVLIWFMLYDPPIWYPYDNGLVTAEDEPRRKLAFTAYQEAVRHLAESSFTQVVSASETGNADLLVYEFFNAAGHPLFIGWMNPIMTEEIGILTLEAETVVVYDIYGNEQRIQDGDDGDRDDKVEIGVDGQPIYIEVIRR